MQMSTNVVPVCMLHVAADPHGLVTSLPFVKCKVSILKITACLLEFRWYRSFCGDVQLPIKNAFAIFLLLMYRI